MGPTGINMSNQQAILAGQGKERKSADRAKRKKEDSENLEDEIT